MALEKELETFERELPALLEHEGKYALIHGSTVVDVYAAYEDALKAGYSKFQLEPFLVKRIEAAEQILYFSRFAECHS